MITIDEHKYNFIARKFSSFVSTVHQNSITKKCTEHKRFNKLRYKTISFDIDFPES